MGDLKSKTPFGEIDAMIEALDHAGITPSLAHRLRSDRDCLRRVVEAWQDLSVNEWFPVGMPRWSTIGAALEDAQIEIEHGLQVDPTVPFAYRSQTIYSYDFNRSVTRQEVIDTMADRQHIPASLEVLIVMAYKRILRNRAQFALGTTVYSKYGSPLRHPYIANSDLGGASLTQVGWEGSVFFAVREEMSQ